jgi:DNA topoisomerase-1
VFAGWLALYGATAERGSAPAETLSDGEVPAPVNTRMPVLARDQTLQAHAVHPAQNFTKPPPRYSEATLVRALEAAGVGRPSTYASLVSTIEERGYVGQASRVFVPTPPGCAVIDYLLERFPSIVDVAFTAQMEDQLDEIAEGKIGWQVMLAGFHGPFSSTSAEAAFCPVGAPQPGR